MKINLSVVKRLLDDTDITGYRIHKDTGISQTAINAYRRGEREFENFKLFTIEKLYEIADKTNKENDTWINTDEIWELISGDEVTTTLIEQETGLTTGNLSLLRQGKRNIENSNIETLIKLQKFIDENTK